MRNYQKDRGGVGQESKDGTRDEVGSTGGVLARLVLNCELVEGYPVQPSLVPDHFLNRLSSLSVDSLSNLLPFQSIPLLNIARVVFYCLQ